MDDYTTLIIDEREVIISSIDKDRVLANIKNLNIKNLKLFIFGINSTYGSKLKIFHKNGCKLDFRRSNLILTDIKLSKKISKTLPYKFYVENAGFNPIGIHLDVNGYEIITFNSKDNLIVENEKLIAEAIKKFDKIYKTLKLEK